MNKWRDVNYDKLVKLCKEYKVDPNRIMTKEKYWRFDISWRIYDAKPSFYRKLEQIEYDSENICQTCWKESKQYRDWWGWYTHHCLKHYLLLKIKIIIRKIKFLFRTQ